MERSRNDTITWEVALFNQLSTYRNNGRHINIIDLIEAYEEKMILSGLLPLHRNWLIRQLDQLKTSSGNNLITQIDDHRLIKYCAFNTSLQWFVHIRKYYGYGSNFVEQITSDLYPATIDWHQYGLVIITSVFDLIIICLVVILKLSFPIWIIIARSSAVLILTNLIYILTPLIGLSRLFPDRILANGFPAEYTQRYHKIFGQKIIIGSVTHTIGHIFQVWNVLRNCGANCDYDAMVIIPASDRGVKVSVKYFLLLYPYLTGIALCVVFGVIMIAIVLSHYNWMRCSTNMLIHKYLSALGIFLTIAHGGAHLLGFNFSYVMTAPLFILYCWKRRRNIIPLSVPITRWIITPSSIRLYLKDDDRLNRMLTKFGNVTIYVNYSRINKLEWHPFALTRGYASTDACLSMKRVGKWTNRLANILSNRIEKIEHIKCGHFLRSKFRFHRLYKVRYFFSAGIGIAAFMATMVDTIRRPMDHISQTILIWSVADMKIVSEFSGQLVDLQEKIPNFSVKIYYSSKANKTQRRPSTMTNIRFEYLQSVVFSGSQIDIVTGMVSPICCNLQRVNFLEILARGALTMRNARNKDPIGIFICGPSAYAKSAASAIALINRNKLGISFRTWTEIG